MLLFPIHGKSIYIYILIRLPYNRVFHIGMFSSYRYATTPHSGWNPANDKHIIDIDVDMASHERVFFSRSTIDIFLSQAFQLVRENFSRGEFPIYMEV